jgi:hypothetical protein
MSSSKQHPPMYPSASLPASDSTTASMLTFYAACLLTLERAASVLVADSIPAVYPCIDLCYQCYSSHPARPTKRQRLSALIVQVTLSVSWTYVVSLSRQGCHFAPTSCTQVTRRWRPKIHLNSFKRTKPTVDRSKKPCVPLPG